MGLTGDLVLGGYYESRAPSNFVVVLRFVTSVVEKSHAVT
jgi:hypothetical protein